MTTDTQEKIKLTLGMIAAQEGGYGMGEPWRYSDESVVAVLPITRELEEERSYLTFTEAGQILQVTETGRINEVEVKNRNGTAVFLRAGEILAGGTQARSIVDSQVVESGEKARIPVVCVHQSRGLRTGAKFTSGGYTPTPLHTHLLEIRERERRQRPDQRYTRSQFAAAAMQGQHWNSINAYTSRLMASSRYTAHLADVGEPVMDTTPRDDLVQAVNRYSHAIGDVIAKVPVVDKQVGLATIGMEGVIAFECYDLKQSWSAIREAAVKQQGEDLSKVV